VSSVSVVNFTWGYPSQLSTAVASISTTACGSASDFTSASAIAGSDSHAAPGHLAQRLEVARYYAMSVT
jgi:hypothetical protein